MLIAINYITVLIFGVLIMTFFLDIKINKRNSVYLLTYILLSTLLQFVLSYFFSWGFIEKTYPLVVHVPLLLFFCKYFNKNFYSVLFVLFSAYAFTSPRKWLGELVASFYDNNIYISIITKILVSIILLVVIYKFLRPYVNRILEYSGQQIVFLTIVPALSYLITYASTVYSDVLYNSNVFVIGLLGLGLNFSFYSFIVAYFDELTKRFASQTEKTILQLQVDTIVTQIQGYKNSQDQSAIFRHDFRHHMQYLNTCIAQNHTDEALSYIAKINKDVEVIQVVKYCDNTTINMILSAYVNKAKNKDISIVIHAVVPVDIPFYTADICVILANGIENAINASSKIEKKDGRVIRVECVFKDKTLLLEIANSYENKIVYKDDIPITNEENHGMGIKSILAVSKKYRGLHIFTEVEGVFKLQMMLCGDPILAENN